MPSADATQTQSGSRLKGATEAPSSTAQNDLEAPLERRRPAQEGRGGKNKYGSTEPQCVEEPSGARLRGGRRGRSGKGKSDAEQPTGNGPEAKNTTPHYWLFSQSYREMPQFRAFPDASTVVTHLLSGEVYIPQTSDPLGEESGVGCRRDGWPCSMSIPLSKPSGHDPITAEGGPSGFANTSRLSFANVPIEGSAVGMHGCAEGKAARRRSKVDRKSTHRGVEADRRSAGGDTARSGRSQASESWAVEPEQTHWLDIQTSDLTVIEQILAVFPLDEFATDSVLFPKHTDSMAFTQDDDWAVFTVICTPRKEVKRRAPSLKKRPSRRFSLLRKRSQSAPPGTSTTAGSGEGGAAGARGRSTSTVASRPASLLRGPSPSAKGKAPSDQMEELREKVARIGVEQPDTIPVRCIVFKEWIITVHEEPFAELQSLIQNVQLHCGLVGGAFSRRKMNWEAELLNAASGPRNDEAQDIVTYSSSQYFGEDFTISPSPLKRGLARRQMPPYMAGDDEANFPGDPSARAPPINDADHPPVDNMSNLSATSGYRPGLHQLRPAWIMLMLLHHAVYSFFPDFIPLLQAVDDIDQAVFTLTAVRSSLDTNTIIIETTKMRRFMSHLWTVMNKKQQVLELLLHPSTRDTFLAESEALANICKRTLTHLYHISDRLEYARDILGVTTSNFRTALTLEVAQRSFRLNRNTAVYMIVLTFGTPMVALFGIFSMNCLIPFQFDNGYENLTAFYVFFAITVAWLGILMVPLYLMLRDRRRESQRERRAETQALHAAGN